LSWGKDKGERSVEDKKCAKRGRGREMPMELEGNAAKRRGAVGNWPELEKEGEGRQCHLLMGPPNNWEKTIGKREGKVAPMTEIAKMLIVEKGVPRRAGKTYRNGDEFEGEKERRDMSLYDVWRPSEIQSSQEVGRKEGRKCQWKRPIRGLMHLPISQQCGTKLIQFEGKASVHHFVLSLKLRKEEGGRRGKYKKKSRFP
jgi:hypothetical protein